MNLKFYTILIFSILCSATIIAQDYNVKKLQKLFDKEMTYQKGGNAIIFETVYPLSISDFEKFQQDVRDSVAIETIFFSTEEDKESLQYLKSNKKTRAHPSEREVNRSLFPLNRDVKNLYTRLIHIPILQFMRVPRDLKPLVNSSISFDDRRIYYETNSEKTFNYSDTTISSTAYPILHNHWELSQLSDSKHDIPDVLAQVLPILFKENVPYNLTENQYKAYLDWKSKKLSSELEKRKIEGEIDITPLFKVDTVEFTITGTELYNQWDIKKSEYDEFVEYSYDSLVRETLFFELDEFKKANKFIRQQEFYFWETHLEYLQFDPTDKALNRKFFSLNYKARIKSRDPDVKEILSRLEVKHKNSLIYSYRTLDLKSSIDIAAPFNMKSYRNQPWFPINMVQIEILPIREADSNSNEIFMQQLNYEQAIAFYTWKYPINKSTTDSNWKNYIFPTKEEFEMMQSNSENTIPNKSFKYSNRTMKYKVKIGD